MLCDALNAGGNTRHSAPDKGYKAIVAAGKRVREGTAVHQLQLTAQRHPMSDTRGDQALVGQQLGNVMRRGFALDRRVGRQDHFGEAALLLDPCQQLRNTDGLRPQTIERRQMALEHKVTAAITGLLHRIDIHRPLDHTQQGVVTSRVGTLRAQVVLGQGAALATVPNPVHGLGQRLGQACAATAITFEQLQGHALGGFLADPGQYPKGVDQLANQRAEAHGR